MRTAFPSQAGSGWHRILLGLCTLFLGLSPFALPGATLSEANDALIEGNYELCIKQCREAIREENRPDEDWFLLLIRAQLTLGQYNEANESFVLGLDETRERSIRLYYLGREVANFQNKPADGASYVEKINELAGSCLLYTSQSPRD